MTTSFESGVQKVINIFKKRPHTAFYANEKDPLHAAFPAKVAVHSGPFGVPVFWGAQAAIDKLADRKRTIHAVAYLHIPFCESRCLYCMFYQNPYDEEMANRYTEGLIKEIRMWSGRKILEGRPLEAVYFGGGTPTALSAKNIKRLVETVKEVLPVKENCEITMEGRINHFSDDKIEAALSAGVNRFSLGIQTFDTDLRRAMQRKDDRETVLYALENMASYKEAATIIDLIYGFPGQTPEIWWDDCITAESLNIGGIDCYQLNVFDKSPLMKQIERGKMPEAPGMAEVADMFATFVDVMSKSKRWNRLSNTHWGRSPLERNIYNVLGRGAGDCLGFGCGAGGKIAGNSYMMERKLSNWFGGIDKGEKPVWVMMRPSPNWHLLRTMASAVETGPFNLNKIGEVFHVPIARLVKPVTDQWVKAGLLIKDEDTFHPTVAGQFWYVTMAQFLVDYLTPKLPSDQSADENMIQSISMPIQNDSRWKLFNGAPK
ncbi:MAG: heme anaerobic degradation radical SAM methyltransferase ChuW/HutW [Burkholderiales bacterium]|nr:heme anaerobic degradation radical SAM methyltransferase ChuW/HutW [Burkholderiales bacterium]